LVETPHQQSTPNSSNTLRGLADRRRIRSFLAHLKSPFLHLFLQLQNPSVVFQDWSPDIPDSWGWWTHGPKDQIDGNIPDTYTQKSA
jgi:hypothetical protein